MKKLTLHPTDDADELAWPEESVVFGLESPALAFFTDFKTTKPLIIESTAKAADLKKLMMSAHVRMKLVLDRQRNFLGIVSAEHLSDQKFMQLVSEGNQRDELLVKDLMTPRKKLLALQYDEIVDATIEDVITALKDWGEQHCLVTESHCIRGIFSASDISRKLQLPIDIQQTSSFYKVFTTAKP